MYVINPLKHKPRTHTYTGPVLQTYFDSDIVAFYSQYYGSETLWNLRAKRQYKVCMGG